MGGNPTHSGKQTPPKRRRLHAAAGASIAALGSRRWESLREWRSPGDTAADPLLGGETRPGHDARPVIHPTRASHKDRTCRRRQWSCNVIRNMLQESKGWLFFNPNTIRVHNRFVVCLQKDTHSTAILKGRTCKSAGRLQTWLDVYKHKSIIVSRSQSDE